MQKSWRFSDTAPIPRAEPTPPVAGGAGVLRRLGGRARAGGKNSAEHKKMGGQADYCKSYRGNRIEKTIRALR